MRLPPATGHVVIGCTIAPRGQILLWKVGEKNAGKGSD